MPTIIVFPDPGTGGGTTAIDGQASRESVDETFPTIIAGAGTEVSTTFAFMAAFLGASTTTDQYAEHIRSIINFDTSSVAPDTVSVAVLDLFVLAIDESLDADSIEVVASTPASNTDLVLADYGVLAAISFGSLATGSASASIYNPITLNAAGRTHIATMGVTNFGVRLGWDLNGVFTGVWSSGAATSIVFSQADEAGTSQDPRLTMTTTDPPVTRYNPRQLAQSRPTGTTPISIYNIPSLSKVEIQTIVVCNTTNSTVQYSIYYDDDGTTYDATTALAFSANLGPGQTEVIEMAINSINPLANLAVQTNTASAINFTVYGSEIPNPP